MGLRPLYIFYTRSAWVGRQIPTTKVDPRAGRVKASVTKYATVNNRFVTISSSSTLAQHWNSIGWMLRVFWSLHTFLKRCISIKTFLHPLCVCGDCNAKRYFSFLKIMLEFFFLLDGNNAVKKLTESFKSIRIYKYFPWMSIH